MSYNYYPQDGADNTQAACTTSAPHHHHQHMTNELSEDRQRRSPTGSSKTDPEETPIWNPSKYRPDCNPFTAWTPDFWRVDTHSRYGRMTFRDFVLPCIAAPSPLKSRREAIPWADEFVQKNYKVYRGFPKTRGHASDARSKIEALADLVNVFVFHMYRGSFRSKVVEGKTQQVRDLREHLCKTLRLDRKGLLHSCWESYDSLKPDGEHFETAVALWRGVLDDPGEGASNRIELLGKRIAIYGESTFGIPGIQTLRDGPVRAAQVLQAHVKSINPASYTFLDVLGERERRIRDLELRLERYKCLAADLYFRHILEHLPGPIPLGSSISATKHWADFLKRAMAEADDARHPLNPLLRLVNDKQKIGKMLGENLYQSLSINIHNEFISLDSGTSTDSHGQIIPDLRYSKLERALFEAILPSDGQAGAQPEWDRERNRYVSARSTSSQSSGWWERPVTGHGDLPHGGNLPRGPRMSCG